MWLGNGVLSHTEHRRSSHVALPGGESACGSGEECHAAGGGGASRPHSPVAGSAESFCHWLEKCPWRSSPGGSWGEALWPAGSAFSRRPVSKSSAPGLALTYATRRDGPGAPAQLGPGRRASLHDSRSHLLYACRYCLHSTHVQSFQEFPWLPSQITTN